MHSVRIFSPECKVRLLRICEHPEGHEPVNGELMIGDVLLLPVDLTESDARGRLTRDALLRLGGWYENVPACILL